jgi:hypothetical protein
MARIVSPGSTSSHDRVRHSAPRPFFVTELVRTYGLRAILALFVAALLAFAPLGVLYWFNEARLHATAVVQSDQKLVVRAGRFQNESAADEPGETALLQVTCDVPTVDGWRELLCDNDPARRKMEVFDPYEVRHELVYLRRAGNRRIPFVALGSPPISVWLPSGNYEILVVHNAPRSESRLDAPSFSFPLITVFAECLLESRRKTVCRLQLPHYDWSHTEPILLVNDDGSSEVRAPTLEELQPWINQYEQAHALPTPSGYVMKLPEPQIRHTEDHRGCTIQMRDTDPLRDAGDAADRAVLREWTRDQLVTVRNWLPKDAVAARARLSRLIDCLEWRQFLQGWGCYFAAGVAGLVFTRWGAISLLEPWRRRQEWNASFWLAIKLFVFFMAVGFVFQVLTGLSVYHGRPPQIVR